MSSIINTTTIETRSALALPIYGRAFGMSTCTPATVWGIDVPVRDRHVAALVKGAFPGTSAWRPPSV